MKEKNRRRIASALLGALLLFSSCGRAEDPGASPDAGEQNDAQTAVISLPAAAKEPEGAAADALLADAVTKFSEQFAKLAAKETEGNAVYSPLSLYYALALTSNGALGATQAEFEKALGMSAEAVNEYLYTLTGRLGESEETKVNISNSLWGNRDRFSVSPDFAAVAHKYYDAEAASVPFDAGTVKTINDWVAGKTDGMITDLFSDLDPEALLVLVNTVLFDGVWEEQYEKSDVEPDTFTLADGTRKQVEFLNSTEYSYFEIDGGKGFSKAYKDGYRFIGVRPDGDAASFVAGMDLGDIIARSAESSLKADCAVPRFEYDTTLGLNDVARGLGIGLAFGEEAELGGLSASGINDIRIDTILQKAKIVLNEHGTKAAAATAIEFGVTAFMPEVRREVRLDKPFFYAIVNSDGIPLFLGVVEDPTA